MESDLTDTGFDAGKIKNNGWCQGAIIPVEMLKETPFCSPSLLDDVWVIVSHDCDIVQADFDKEPNVEVIRGSKIKDPDGNYTYGKNVRVLHIQEKDTWIELLVKDRSTVPRELLCAFAPTGCLSRENTARVRRWIAHRYVRDAFPDEFNRRLGHKKPELRKIAQSSGMDIESIWVSMPDNCQQNLSTSSNYQLELWTLMLAEDYEDKRLRERGQKFVAKFAACIDECPGVEVIDFELRSTALFSRDDELSMKRFDYDDLSMRSADPESFPKL